MISMKLTIDDDILEAVNEAALTSPKRMQRAFLRAILGVKVRMLAELQTEPQPASDFYPLRWTSRKQQQKVMAMLREADNLPYDRTGRLLSGYHVRFVAVGDVAGYLVAENDAPEARYVVGDDAQPMFIENWVQMAPVVADYRAESEEVVIDTWYRVAL